MLGIERSVNFPVYIACNFLVYTPIKNVPAKGETAPQNISRSDVDESHEAPTDNAQQNPNG